MRAPQRAAGDRNFPGLIHGVAKGWVVGGYDTAGDTGVGRVFMHEARPTGSACTMQDKGWN